MQFRFIPRPLSIAFALGALGCSPDLLSSLPHLEGQWGGEGMEFSGTASKVVALIGCYTVEFEGPVVLGPDGSFVANGVIVNATWGSPIGIIARFDGVTRDDTTRVKFSFQERDGSWTQYGFRELQNGVWVKNVTFLLLPGRHATYSDGLFCPV